MTYPGNETLAEEIRERILNTFRQTLELVENGDLREAQLGCDFVLRLDPLFELVETQGRHYGSLVRQAYGEPFYSEETVAVEDVVRLSVQSM